jgi:formate hydrogenlyase subunit 3/multisubunit Na+/H+ antiporter MnhD subunit
MASFGTLALLLAFGLLSGPDGLYTFAQIRAAHPTAGLAALALILALIGAGSKAGLVPLHVWLPLAHPAAPSHVSALMSGVMTKVAVYGFVRIVFDLMGEPAWWWSMVVLALGGLTAVMGVLYALMQHDLKRLLAYHTVENIGIIFIGLGLALAFKAHGMTFAAALALTAGLLHVFIPSSKACCSSAPAPCSRPPASATWNIWAVSSIACRKPHSCSWSAASRSRRCPRSMASSPNG